MDELAIWTAGFFDGEGCVRFQNHPRKRSTIQPELIVTVAQREQIWLIPIQLRWGGSVRNDRGCHVLRLRTLAAETFLRDMLPHLRVKKAQAEIALDLREFMRSRHKGRSHGYSTEEKFKIEGMISQISALKKPVS